MTTTPAVHCPFCGTPLKILDTLPTASTERTALVSICRCGVFDIIVRQNKLAAITLRSPELHPDFQIRYR